MVQAPSRETRRGEEPDGYPHANAPPFSRFLVLCAYRTYRMSLQNLFLEVKRYVRKGVPNEHRTRIWMAASGAQEQLELNPGYYQSLLASEHDARVEETIRIGMSTGLNSAGAKGQINDG